MRIFSTVSSRPLRRVALVSLFAVAATMLNAVPAQAAAATHVELLNVSANETANRTVDTVLVQLLDGNNNVDASYSTSNNETVTFSAVGCATDCLEVRTSNDMSTAPLANDRYTFSVFGAGDQGQKNFFIRWNENAVGTKTLRVTATLPGGGTDVDDADTATTVASNAAASLDLVGVQTSAMAGSPEAITVDIKNPQGQTNPNTYTGVVTFSASCGDCFTITPNDGSANAKKYTFVPADNGTKGFQLTWTNAAVGSGRTFTATASDLVAPTTDDSETRSPITVQAAAATTTTTTTTAPPTTTTTTTPGPPRTKAAQVVTGAGAGGGPHVLVRRASNPSQVLFSFYAYDPAFAGGVRVATGDVDGDGFDDIITAPGPGGGPHIKVFSGKDLTVLSSFFAYAPNFTGGVFVASADVDGDGKDDIVTGPDAGGGPHVLAFSGATGGVLRSFFAYAPSFSGGVRVAAGQFDNDNNADIVTAPGPGGGPHVQVFSGSTGGALRSFFAYAPSFTGGVFVAADRSDEAIVYTGVGPGGGPHVRLFDASGEVFGFMAGDSTHGAIPAVGESTGAASSVAVVSRAAADPLVRFFDPVNGNPAPGTFPAYGAAIGVYVAVGVL
ncbi:MAG TPA: VCBS repeat-containing protein [Acidimicrobiales bacterium]|nr:VCBS repeat-containing protein [Acidimicrobiales bacterium]